jgi:hypothetical protein
MEGAGSATEPEKLVQSETDQRVLPKPNSEQDRDQGPSELK